MNARRIGSRWMAAPLLVALAVSAVAPAAEARHGGSRRYKDVECGARERRPACAPPRVIEARGSSCNVPALAGFIGGLALSAILADRTDRDVTHYEPACDERFAYYTPASEERFAYYDPYCDQRFASLEIYRAHLGRHRHPRIVRVIEIDSGDCVHSYRYSHGGWRDWDDESDE